MKLDTTRILPDPVKALEIYEAAVKDAEVAKKNLAHAKMTLLKLAFPDIPAGKKTTTQLGVARVSATIPQYIHVDNAALPSVLSLLPDKVVDGVIRYKPSVIRRAYDKLPEHQRLILDEALRKSEGAPTITISYPAQEGE